MLHLLRGEHEPAICHYELPQLLEFFLERHFLVIHIKPKNLRTNLNE
jgi:hypothetical protein